MPTLKRDREDMAEDGARKRSKLSPAVDGPRSVFPTVMDLTNDETPSNPAADASLSQELQTLNTLRGDFDSLRQLNTCKICERLMYEPYVISCGHTYCYSCLCTWFATSHKKTCPNCRELITQAPAPSYVIREMIHIFMNRHHLLPDGETIEQHQQWAFEEAEMVRNDKSNGDSKTGGLFKGVFRKRRERLLPNHDPIDHVDRCPRCNWEIEDGMCVQCNIHMDSWSDTDSDSSSDMHGESIPDDFEDEDLDADAEHGEFDMDFTPEEYAAWMRTHDILGPESAHSTLTRREARQLREELVRSMHRARRHNGRFPGGWNHHIVLDEASEDDIDLNEEDEDEDEIDDDDEDAGSLDEFVDDRDINDITAYTMSSPIASDDTPARRDRRRNRREQREFERQAMAPIDISSAASGSASSSESESDSDSDGVRHNPHFRRPQVPVYEIPSDDDEEPVAPLRRRTARVIDSEEDDDEDEEPQPTSRRTRRPIVVDSDEEPSSSDSSSEEEDETDHSSRPCTHNRHSNNPQKHSHAHQLNQTLDSSDQDSSDDDENNVNSEDYSSMTEPSRPASQEPESDEYDSDAVAAGANFSPMSDGQGEQEGQLGYFDVYGEEVEDEGEGGGYEDYDDDEDCY